MGIGEVEFFDRIKKANRYLNNNQRQILLDIIYQITANDMPWDADIEYNKIITFVKDKENK